MLIKICIITTENEYKSYNVFAKYDEWKEYCEEQLYSVIRNVGDGTPVEFDCGYIDIRGVYHEPKTYKGIHESGDYNNPNYEYFLFVDYEGTPLYCAVKFQDPDITNFPGHTSPIKFFKYNYFTEDPSNMDDDSEVEMVYVDKETGKLKFDLINTVYHGTDENATAEYLTPDILFYHAYAFDEEDDQMIWGMLVNVNTMATCNLFYDDPDSVASDDSMDVIVQSDGIIVIKNSIDRDEYKDVPIRYVDSATMEDIEKES